MINDVNPKPIQRTVDDRQLIFIAFGEEIEPAMIQIGVRDSQSSKGRLKAYMAMTFQHEGQDYVVPVTTEFRMEMN